MALANGTSDENPNQELDSPESSEDEIQWQAGRQEIIILSTMSVLSIVIAVSPPSLVSVTTPSASQL